MTKYLINKISIDKTTEFTVLVGLGDSDVESPEVGGGSVVSGGRLARINKKFQGIDLN